MTSLPEVASRPRTCLKGPGHRRRASAASAHESRQERAAMNDLISVLISIYDRPDALDAVLRGLSRQTDRNFEVIASDDGSPPSTAAVVQSWKDRLGVPLAHVWHEHRGFRAPEISNRAILKSRGAYCVFLDGDCIPRPGFIAAHRRLAEPGWFVFGNRILMYDALTARVPAGRHRTRDLELRGFHPPPPRDQPADAADLAAARAVAQARHAKLGKRAHLQSGGLARGPRQGERPGRALRRLGAARFRSRGAADPLGVPAQGRPLRDRRAASLRIRRRTARA